MPTENQGRAIAPSAEPESVERLKEILERQGVPPAKAEIVLREVTTEIVRAHAGPLPSVEDFAGYDEICPGSAQEILDMAVRQQTHRHHMEKYNAGSEFWLPALGLAAAVIVVLAMLGAGVCLALTGHENLAVAVVSGTGIVTAVGAFLQRNKSEEPNLPKPVPSRDRHLSRREKRERASQTRKNIINR